MNLSPGTVTAMTGVRRCGLTILLTAAVGTTFWNVLLNGFVYDDHFNIEKSAFVQRQEPLSGLFTSRYYRSAHEFSYRPVMTVSLWLDCRLWGSGPRGFHLTNLVLHVVNVVLLFWLLRNLSANSVPAALGALVFGLHPVQSEPVAVASFREELLMAAFMLGAAVAGHRYVGTGAARWFVAAVAGALLAAFSKETSWFLPVGWATLGLLWWGASELEPRRRMVRLLWGFCIVVTMAVVTSRWLVSPSGTAMGFPLEQSFVQKPASVAGTVPFVAWLFWSYVRLVVWPASLSMDHRPSFSTVSAPVLWVAWAGLAIAVVLAIRWLRGGRGTLAVAGLTVFLIFLLPAFYIVPVRGILAERYLYVPLIGVGMLVTALLQPRWDGSGAGRRWALGIAGITVLTLAARTVVRNADWRDDRTLWMSTLRTSPHSFAAYNNLGVVEAEHGQRESAKVYFEQALRLAPQYYVAQDNLGKCLMDMGRYGEAVQVLQQAVAAAPFYATAWNNLGVACARLGRRREARESFLSALRAAPDYGVARRNLLRVESTR